jgi:hypothetical protein
VATVGGPKGPVFLDTNIAKEEVTVKPVEEQDEWESRRLWVKVAKGIRTGDYDTAGKEKSRIEVSGARSGLKLVVVTEVPGTSEIGIVTPVVIAIVTPVVALFVTPVVALFVTPVVTPIVIPIATLIVSSIATLILTSSLSSSVSSLLSLFQLPFPCPCPCPPPPPPRSLTLGRTSRGSDARTKPPRATAGPTAISPT